MTAWGVGWPEAASPHAEPHGRARLEHRMQAEPLLPPDPTRQRMTLEAWGALDEDMLGELVDGQLTEAEVPDGTHETVVMWLALRLGNWAEDRGRIRAGLGSQNRGGRR